MTASLFAYWHSLKAVITHFSMDINQIRFDPELVPRCGLIKEVTRNGDAIVELDPAIDPNCPKDMSYKLLTLRAGTWSKTPR